MSSIRPRSHSSDSPDRAGCQRIRGRVNVTGGNSGEDLGYCQFQGNRRRRDGLPSYMDSHCPPVSLLSSHSKGSNDSSSGSHPKFPMTPAEFHLFPAALSTPNTRISQNTVIATREECLGVGHLTTLRSAAFWELRQSVIDNGERLIRRMRDYEQFRVHHQVRQKAKDRKKRGRKPSTLRSRCTTRPNVSEAEDEDDVLICSEDTSKTLSSWSALATRARSLDPMDVDGDQDHLGRRGSRSMPGADHSQVQLRNDEGIPFSGISLRTKGDSESLSPDPESASPTPSSSSISLPLPLSLSMADRTTEKLLTELNVAFAQGACSINDYSPIWTYQQQFNTDEHDRIRQGQLWQ